MFDDPSAIVEYELEKMRNELRPEAVPIVRSKLSWKWILLFFVGVIIWRLMLEIIILLD